MSESNQSPQQDPQEDKSQIQHHQNEFQHESSEDHQEHENYQNHEDEDEDDLPQPQVNPASAVDGGREISRTVLYVGGIDNSVSEESLTELISSTAQVQLVKILNDKNKSGYNYAFVEFPNEEEALIALEKLNGTSLNDSHLRINYAYQSATFNTVHNSEEPTFNIFVGDLSPDVDDEALHNAFSQFRSLKQAHVMWDMQTSRSRGYGFVTFGSADDAEAALDTMHGKIINGRSIRCNWASHKQNQNSRNFSLGLAYNGNRFHRNNRGYQRGQDSQLPSRKPYFNDNSYGGESVMSPQSYDMVLRQTPSWQTTVYLGNLAHFTQEDDLIPLLQNFGYIVGFKLHADKGCAFVKYDTHERAALAIVQLGGFNFNGRPLKCGWGKSKPQNGYQQRGYQRR